MLYRFLKSIYVTNRDFFIILNSERTISIIGHSILQAYLMSQQSMPFEQITGRLF